MFLPTQVALNAAGGWDRLDPIMYALATHMGDFVVRRKDGIPAYQIASLADDVYFGINAVVRGVDLLPSSAAQVWLATRLARQSFVQPSSTIRW